MTANQRNRALTLLVAALLCLSLEIALILAQGPETLAAAAGFASYALAIYGAGYAATVRGHSRLWAFLGLLNFLGILIVFCFKDLVHVSPPIKRRGHADRAIDRAIGEKTLGSKPNNTLYRNNARPKIIGRDKAAVMPEISETDPSKLRQMALDSLRKGNLKIATDAWRSLAKAEPETAETHFLRAAALHAMRDIDAAAEEYRSVVGLERTNAEAHLCLGMLLTDNAVDKMSKTGQRFTMDGALKHYGRLDDALRAFATAEALNEKLQAETIEEHLRHYTVFLGAVYMMAKPVDDLTGDSVYRKRCDWLRFFGFSEDDFGTWTISQVADRIRDSQAQNRALLVLGHRPLPSNLAAILKHRKQKALQIGPTMKDSVVRNALKTMQPGSVVLGDIERVALGSDFSWIQQESINRADLIMLDSESMLLPEIMGALQRTAKPETEDFERRCFFVTMTK